MKKIILSLSVMVAVAAVLVGATTAFYNDTEVSTGNTFTAGAIDLGIDNESYYNGDPREDLSWELEYDMSQNPHLFFDYRDLKPGDWGEDTISLHVKDNDAWLCVDVTLTKNDDVTCTEPEGDVDACSDESDNDMWDGDLAQELKWYWWADDGDNVFEEDETLINNGVSFPNSDMTHHVTLADSDDNIWMEEGTGPVEGGTTYYIGKAWCFGDSTFIPHPQDQLGGGNQNGPNVRGVNCDGSQVGNESQSDVMMMDLAFRAEQWRNNPDFDCQPVAQ